MRSWGARCEGRGAHVAVLLRSGRVQCCAHVARRWSGDWCVGSASELGRECCPRSDRPTLGGERRG
eukprot:3566701-Prymnesium_polylepis.1